MALLLSMYQVTNKVCDLNTSISDFYRTRTKTHVCNLNILKVLLSLFSTPWLVQVPGRSGNTSLPVLQFHVSIKKRNQNYQGLYVPEQHLPCSCLICINLVKRNILSLLQIVFQFQCFTVSQGKGCMTNGLKMKKKMVMFYGKVRVNYISAVACCLITRYNLFFFGKGGGG